MKSNKFTMKKILTALLVTVLVCMALGAALAEGTPKFSGSITGFSLYSGGDYKPGVAQQYKVSVNKAGTMLVYLTDNSSGTKKLVEKKSVPSAGKVLISIPGSLIADDKEYTVTLSYGTGSTKTGSGTAEITTKHAVSRIDDLKVPASVSLTSGGSLNVTFSLADKANVTCYITDSSNTKVATVASNQSMKAGSNSLTWGGSLSSGGFASSGTYYLNISCTNGGGTYTCPAVSFSLESSADMLPLAVKGYINSAIFMNAPRVSQKAVLTVNVSKAGTYAIKLSDTTSSTGYKYTGKLSVGSNNITFPASVFVENHKYKLQLVETSGSTTIGQAAGAFIPAVDKPELTGCLLGASEFDGENVMYLPVTFNNTVAGNINITVTDGSGSVKASIVSNTRYAAGSHTVNWYGLGTDSKALPEGTYNVNITCSNSAGTAASAPLSFKYSVKGDMMSVPATGNVTMALFKNAPHVGVDAKLTLNVKEKCDYTIKLGDATNGKSYTYTGSLSVGINDVTIPGSVFIENHKYKLQLVTTNKNKVTTGKAASAFVPIVDPPEVTSFSLGSKKLDTNGSAGLAISFTNSLSANTYISVKNSSGSVVAKVLNGERYGAGAHTVTWYGMNTNGKMLPSGDYTLSVTCSNSAGSDTEGPLSFSYVTSPDPMTGAVKGSITCAMFRQTPRAGKSAILFVYTSMNGNYQIKMGDSTNGKSYKLAGTFYSGINRVTIPASYLIEGHTYKLQLVQSASSKTVGQAAIGFTAVIDPPEISNFSLGATSVNADYGAALPITFDLSNKAKVNVYIRNSIGEVVAHPVAGTSYNAGTVEVYWDGKDSSGSLLPADDYKVTISCSNSVGSDAAGPLSFSYERPDSTKKPGSTGKVLSFNVIGDPQPVERTAMKFSLLTASKGTVKITLINNKTGARTAVLQQTVTSPSTVFTIPGSYLLGYEYIVQATLYSGTGATIGTGKCYVSPQRIAPSIKNFYIPEAFDPSADDVVMGNLEIGTRGYVYVTVRNSEGAVVRKLINGAGITDKVSFVWDGRKDSGVKAANGKYTVNAYYVDTYGVSSEVKTIVVRLSSGLYPEGVYGYRLLGSGNYKDRVYIYSQKGGGEKLGYTYCASATFKVLKTYEDWLYVDACMPTGAPLRGYVKTSLLEMYTITSPYRFEICIDQKSSKAQTMWLYKDGVLIDTFNVSTGAVEDQTPTGDYLITNRLPYFINSGAICYHALRVVGGVCIHRVPEIDGSYSLAKQLGKIASHGCIRVPVDRSEWLYENIPDTTPVHIFGSYNK